PVTVTNYMGMGKPAFCQYICPAGTLQGGIPLLSTHEELRRTIGALFSLKMAILILTVVGCIFIYRFFCRTLCPLGAIYGIMNKVSLCRLEVDKDRCIDCGKCKNICKMEVDPVREPDSAECIRCGACAHACPKCAIYVGMAGRRTAPARLSEKQRLTKQDRKCRDEGGSL
ncbi:MAG: 4Fe-4S binding protein, partial [Lachnospiraceae bacterium]|nr:4Fe-4S binding protein [Lachnospiraceae bacterium]